MWMSPGRRPIHGTRPTSTSTTPARAIKSPKAMRILPTSFMTSFEEALLPGGGGGGLLAQVPVRLTGDASAVGRPHDEADLQEVGLDHLGQSLGLVVDGGGDRLEAHRAPAVVVDDRAEETPVEAVEAARLHALAVEGAARDVLGHAAVALHLGVVAHPAEQAVRDARRSAGAARDLGRAVWLDPRVQDHRGAVHDPGELGLRVKVQMMEDPEGPAP